MMSLDSWRQTARRLLALLRRSPVTVGLVAALWLVAIATGSLLSGPTDSLMAQVAVGPPTLAAGRWWTLLTALFWCQGLLSYLTTTVLLLVVGVPAERLLGRRRSALVLLTSQVAGGLVAVGLVALGASVIGSSWNDDPTAFTVVGPSAALTGLGFALTFRLSALWRRRLRLLLGTGVVVMLLYSGTLQDLFRVVDGVVGLVVGLIVLGRATRGSTSAPSRSEAKVLVALAVAATAMGPIITTLLSRQGLAPLGVLQTLLTSSDGDPGDIQDLCTNNPDPAQLAQCRLAQARTLGTGIGSAITSIGLSLVLLAAAEGLRRGRRFAWWLALAFNLALSIGSTLLAGIAMLWLSGGDTADSWLLVFLIPPALVPIAVVGLLAATRKVFTVSAPRRTYRRLGLMLIVSLAATSTVYVLGGYLDRAHFDPVPALGDLLADLPNRFLPPGYTSLLTGFDVSPVFLPTGGLAMVVWEFSGAVFWVILLVGLVVSFWRARLVDDKDA
ncbi:MAG: rhomboid family intramembrane serine protease, partial [Kutzneria sp.]|nr:rhomboid family intramembrane serine protease [Kutzneria sp.]